MHRQLKLSRTAIVIITSIFLIPAMTAVALTGNVSNKSVTVSKYATVPVHYVTDRNLKGDTFGNRRRYLNNCLHKMYYGTAYVNVPNINREIASDTLTALDWQLTNKKGKMVDHNDRIQDNQNPRSHFFERIQQTLDKNKTDTICVYVPGAEEDFANACLEAGQLEYYLKRPIILYSWPSNPRIIEYFVDNNNSEWSQGHFRRFIRHLDEFKEKHPLQVVFIAHSMGNRFLLRSMHELYSRHLAADVELVSADIDLDTCRHYLLGFRRVDTRSAIRFYVSHRDRMLKISQRIFGGYARLGEDVEHQLGPSRSVQDVIVQKDRDVSENDQIVSTNPLPAVAPLDQSREMVIESDEGQTRNDHEVSDSFEVVDFTAMDTGFNGHSLPFQLIGDMVNGKQPDGFKIVAENKKSGRKHLKVLKVGQSK